MTRIHIIYYLTLKALIRQGLKTFYRKWDIHGYDENVPKNTPIIFAGNHQNAFIDPLNIVCSTKKERRPSFLTRSDVFVNKIKHILFSFRMLPIYRQRDGVDTLQKNEEIFQICVDRLANKEAIIIFPEGNHDDKKRIRPIKKGAARIAFQAEDQNDHQLGIHIVPVGVNYSAYRNFRGDVLVNYGKPIVVSDYYELYQENSQRALVKITQDIRQGMKDTVIDISSREDYDVIERLFESFGKDNAVELGLNPKKFHDVFVAEKDLIQKIEADFKEDSPAIEEVRTQTRLYKDGLKKLKMRDHVIARPPKSRFVLLLGAIALILGLPVHLYGVLHNYIPYKIADRMALKFFKDDHFHSSIRFGVGFFLFPIYYLLLFLIAWGITDILTATVYLVSLPLSGNFAMFYSTQVKKWYARWKYLNLLNAGDTLLSSVIAAREKMSHYVSGIIKGKPEPEKVQK